MILYICSERGLWKMLEYNFLILWDIWDKSFTIQTFSPQIKNWEIFILPVICVFLLSNDKMNIFHSVLKQPIDVD